MRKVLIVLLVLTLSPSVYSAGRCFSLFAGSYLSFKAGEVQHWNQEGLGYYQKDILVKGATLKSVVDVLQNVNPHEGGFPFVEISDLPSPQAPNVRNYNLKVSNPAHSILGYFGLPRFLSGPDVLYYLSSTITMYSIENGFRMDVKGPVANGFAEIVAIETSFGIVVREIGTLGGSIPNAGHNFVFDLVPLLRKSLERPIAH